MNFFKFIQPIHINYSVHVKRSLYTEYFTKFELNFQKLDPLSISSNPLIERVIAKWFVFIDVLILLILFHLAYCGL